MRNQLSTIHHFLLLILITLSFATCSKEKSKQIDPAFAQFISNFTYGTIAPQSYIQVQLTQDMPTVELNAEVKEQLFSFSPKISGSTMWIDSRTLRFIPDDDELKPGKEYKAKLHLGKMLKVDKKFNTFDFYFKVSEQNFNFDLLPYMPSNTNNLNWNRVEGVLKLINRASVENVRDIFSLNANREASIKIEYLGETTYRVVIDSLQRTSEERLYTLEMNGKSIGVKKKEIESIKFSAIPEEQLDVVDVRIYDDGSKSVRITFSSPLDPNQDILGLATLAEVSNYTYRTDKNVLYLYPESFPKGELKVQLHEGLRNNIGLALKKDYLYQLKVEDEKPQIKMDRGSNILPKSNQLVLPFSAVNLWAIDVKVIKIYENNILHFLQTGSLASRNQGEVRRFGRLIKKLRVRLDSDKTKDLSRWNQFAIDLAPLFKQDDGAVYMIQLSMKQDYSLYSCGTNTPIVPEAGNNRRSFSDELITEEDEAEWDKAEPYYYELLDWSSYNWEDRDNPCTPSYYMGSDKVVESFVLSSNIGLIAKRGSDDKLLVAATDILSTNPIAGAKISLYNYQMQIIGTGKSDKNGFVEIDYSKSKPYLVTAEKSEDKAYLELRDEQSLSLSNFDVSGKEVQRGIKGFPYAERGIWRPGDTIHLSFILENKELDLPANHPVSLEVYTPTRQFYTRQVKTSQENGFYTFSIATDASDPTGVWQSYIKVGGATFYHPLRIETIKPNRLKVRLETDSIFDAKKEIFTGSLHAQWLHGAPASNMKSEVTLSLSKSEHPFNGYEKFTFNNPLINYYNSQHKIFDEHLDAAGSASIRTKLPKAENAPGMLRGNILSKVYEMGGDMSFYSQSIFYSPFSTYVGVKAPSSTHGEWLETDQPFIFDVVSLKDNGEKTVNQKLSYKIYKLEWSWWWSSSEEDLSSYINSTSARAIAEGNFTAINGRAKIDFQVDYPDWGRYIILVKDKESGHTSGSIFYVDWPESRGIAEKKDPNGFTMLTFSTDKPDYEVGEKVTVTIPKSSEGRVLVSLESGSQILSREWIKTSSEKDTQYSFTVTDEMSPNVYLFATLLQPHAQTMNDLPIRMYGVQNIEIKNEEKHLTPTISMPNEVKPEKEFIIHVSEKEKKAMTYTLAIVDEGLLDLTGFKTPNPLDYFYAREALGVRTWDLFDRVLGANSGMFGPLLSIGGDEALKASSDRINRFKPIVRFMGPFTIKANESKKHTVKLPQYVGSVRVMVVAANEGAYGSAGKTIAVNNPLMTLSTLPRVLGPEEEVYLPVNIFVTDNSIDKVKVSVKTSNLLKVEGATSQSVSFDKEGDKTVYFKLKAGRLTGVELVKISAIAGDDSFVEDVKIEIRNPQTPTMKHDYKLLESNESGSLKLKLNNSNNDDWAKLELSRMPTISLEKNLDYLATFPHQSTEQLVSQAFPLLYLDELMKVSEDRREQLKKDVEQAIKRVATRQLTSGGFTDWTTNTFASEWTTTYVGHFLTEAKNRGFEVPFSVYSSWQQFQSRLSRNWSRTVSTNGYYPISMTELQQAYRLYSLALSGEPQMGAMNRMREIKNLSLQAKWRLAASYAIAGRKEVANEIIYNLPDEIDGYSANNDTYGNSARDRAMIMETYLLLDKIEKALTLSQAIANELSSRYVSSHTISYGLIAMSQLAKEMGQTNIEIDWWLNGKKMNAINSPQAFEQIDIEVTDEIEVIIENRGKGKIYAELVGQSRPLFDEDAAISYNNDELSLKVDYIDANGKSISPLLIDQGVEFTAIIKVKNHSSQPLNDLALTQLFPAGWEIQNERVVANDSINSENNYIYRDIRDDRVLTYFNLNSGQTKKFKVSLQAAYRGKFFLAPVSCQALHNPRLRTSTGGTWIEIVEGKK